MSTDITYCANSNSCKLKDKCKRSDYPKSNKLVWLSNFYNESEIECEHFIERLAKVEKS